jgi:hypothetical protein
MDGYDNIKTLHHFIDVMSWSEILVQWVNIWYTMYVHLGSNQYM